MRRRLKICVITGFVGFILLFPIFLDNLGAASNPRGDGRITLYSYHTDDVLEIVFRTPTGYDKKALKEISKLMRCRGTGKEYAISTQLIDLLDNIQDHFGVETVEIISGYRSPSFNDYLITNKRGAAGESLHTKGMAADIHIDEITERALWEYVKSVGVGGAGYYPRHNFVHIDVGPRRIWSEPEPTERILTGTELSPNEGWSALTDKNIYKPGESIQLTITNEMPQLATLTKNIWYERFRKGRWAEHEKIVKTRSAARVSPGKSVKYTVNPGELAYGKYRLVIFTSSDFNIPPAYSNEFYVKKTRD